MDERGLFRHCRMVSFEMNCLVVPFKILKTLEASISLVSSYLVLAITSSTTICRLKFRLPIDL
jgi:hypothetical protein